MILEGKIPFKHRSYFYLWSETKCAKKARWRTSSYRCRQHFPPVVSKMCWIPCFRITSSKIWKSTNRCRHQRGTELASHVFRCLIESPQPKENDILKIDFENAFNSINRQLMLEKKFEIHPEVYKYSHSAYSQPSFLLYGDSVIKFVKGPSKEILSLQLYFRIPISI